MIGAFFGKRVGYATLSGSPRLPVSGEEVSGPGLSKLPCTSIGC